jgi:hypothetical protein
MAPGVRLGPASVVTVYELKTNIPDCVPESTGAETVVAVMACVPRVLSVAVKVCAPASPETKV